AVLLARRGDFGAAGADIAWCREREPHSGATLYAAACVASRRAERAAPAQARGAVDQALALLAEAFERHYGQDRAGQDPDLAAVRNHPEFHWLLRQKRKDSERMKEEG